MKLGRMKFWKVGQSTNHCDAAAVVFQQAHCPEFSSSDSLKIVIIFTHEQADSPKAVLTGNCQRPGQDSNPRPAV